MSRRGADLCPACHCHCQLQNLSTPQVIDLLGGGSVHLILQSARYFALIDSIRGLQLYTYEGRAVCNPRLPTARAGRLRAGVVSLSDDVVAVGDRNNTRCTAATAY